MKTVSELLVKQVPRDPARQTPHPIHHLTVSKEVGQQGSQCVRESLSEAVSRSDSQPVRESVSKVVSHPAGPRDPTRQPPHPIYHLPVIKAVDRQGSQSSRQSASKEVGQ